jgi:hypothetical protein
MTLVILFPRVFVYGAYVCQPKGTYRSDWRGESRETLLKRPDVLGLEVRRRPRAYLVLPEITARKRNNQAVRFQRENQWFPGPLAVQPSGRHMTVDQPMYGPQGEGPALTTTIHWNTGEVVHQWPSLPAFQPSQGAYQYGYAGGYQGVYQDGHQGGYQGGFSGPPYGMPATVSCPLLVLFECRCSNSSSGLLRQWHLPQPPWLISMALVVAIARPNLIFKEVASTGPMVAILRHDMRLSRLVFKHFGRRK